MKTKALLFIIFAATLFAIATFVSIIFNTSPTTIGVIVLFYASFILSCFGIMFLVGYLVNFFNLHTVPPWHTTVGLIRTSTIVAIVLSAILAMKSFSLLNLPTFFVLLALAIIAEIATRRYTVKIRNSKNKDISI